MRLHRFYIPEEISGDTLHIEDADKLNQWKNVFRMSAGDTVLLFDITGDEYEAEITLLSKKEADVRLIKKIDQEKSSLPVVHLYLPLIKKDKVELVLEKGTELGVASFTPVITDRTVVKNIPMERARKIIIEASEQSGRVTVPAISEAISLREAVGQVRSAVVFDGEGRPFTEYVHSKQEEVSIFIGPEGGWSEEEKILFEQKGIQIYSLGTQVLRAETAAIASSALLLLK